MWTLTPPPKQHAGASSGWVTAVWGWHHSWCQVAAEDKRRSTYSICEGSIYLSQAWGSSRRRAAGGSGSGRIWTGSGRRAPWPRSGCCSSSGVSLRDTGEKTLSGETAEQQQGETTGPDLDLFCPSPVLSPPTPAQGAHLHTKQLFSEGLASCPAATASYWLASLN